MDPVTLLAVASALLGGGSLLQEAALAPEKDPAWIVRTLWRDPSTGWEATELLSTGVLDAVGTLFDLELDGWAPALRTGFYKAAVLGPHDGSGTGKAAVIRLAKAGLGWTLDVGYGPHGTTLTDEQRRVIEVLLATLNATAPSEAVGDVHVYTFEDGGRVWRIATAMGQIAQGAIMGQDIEGWMRDGAPKTGNVHLFKLTAADGHPTATFALQRLGTSQWCVIETAGIGDASVGSTDDERIESFVRDLNAATPDVVSAACPSAPTRQIEERPWAAPGMAYQEREAAPAR
jgi:hypothetical protein